jgi:hypothetical protein
MLAKSENPIKPRLTFKNFERHKVNQRKKVSIIMSTLQYLRVRFQSKLVAP